MAEIAHVRLYRFSTTSSSRNHDTPVCDLERVNTHPDYRSRWAQGALYRVACACGKSYAHLACLLGRHNVPLPDDGTGYYRFICKVCGTDLDLGCSDDSASAALLCLALRGHELMAETWFNTGEEGSACRMVVALPED